MASNSWEMRKWGDFFDTSSMSIPTNKDSWSERVESNIQFYRANYIILFCGMFVFSLYFIFIVFLFTQKNRYSFPRMIIPFAIGVGLLVAAVGIDDVKIGGRRLSFIEKIVASLVVLLILLWLLSAVTIFFSTFVISVGVILAHATLRKQSVRAKVTNFFSDIKSEIQGVASDFKKEINDAKKKLG